jgi:hypothetical protein
MIDGLFEWPNGKAQVLAVILHGWASNREKISDVKNATLDALGSEGGVDVYVPTLAYSRLLSVNRATTILIDLLCEIDKIVEMHPGYKRIVLIGHSMGGVLSRRLFLLAAGVPPTIDGHAEFRYEEELICKEAAPRPWAGDIWRRKANCVRPYSISAWVRLLLSRRAFTGLRTADGTRRSVAAPSLARKLPCHRRLRENFSWSK